MDVARDDDIGCAEDRDADQELLDFGRLYDKNPATPFPVVLLLLGAFDPKGDEEATVRFEDVNVWSL